MWGPGLILNPAQVEAPTYAAEYGDLKRHIRSLASDSGPGASRRCRHRTSSASIWPTRCTTWSAIRFCSAKSKDKVIVQDSALMQARNLLEFTKPGDRPRRGWWIEDLGAPIPAATPAYEDWVRFINAKVTHLGEERLTGPSWPVPEGDERLIAMSRFALERIRSGLPTASTDPHVAVLLEVTRLGLEYLDDPTPERIKALADLVG